jgi:GMP synthase-like glutamine amidotransferase
MSDAVRQVLVLQHIGCEPPGVYEDVLRERGATLVRVELDEGEALPGLDGIAAIVAMGGPMSVNDEQEHPWLVAEKRLIRDGVGAGIPFFGACLGVQLLASSLGARVTTGGVPEVGVLPVFGTDAALDDPVFSGLAWPRPTLQWHSDTFELPDGATLLATSPAYPHQAFRVGERAYGVQFHLEVTDEMADEWARVPEYAVAADRALGAGGLERLLDEFRTSADEMRADARTLFSRWVDLWAAR